MSTRATVKIMDEQDTFWLYHHCDGYPEGVGKTLYDYVQKNTHNAFKMAENVATDLVKLPEDKYGNFEITGGQHGDVEYTYEITVTNEGFDHLSLKCFELHKWGGEYSPEDEIDLKERLKK